MPLKEHLTITAPACCSPYDPSLDVPIQNYEDVGVRDVGPSHDFFSNGECLSYCDTNLRLRVSSGR